MMKIRLGPAFVPGLFPRRDDMAKKPKPKARKPKPKPRKPRAYKTREMKPATEATYETK